MGEQVGLSTPLPGDLSEGLSYAGGTTSVIVMFNSHALRKESNFETARNVTYRDTGEN